MPDDGPILLSILIVSYNTREMTLACLDSLVSETRDVSFEVIIVDNASSDGSAAALEAHASHPRVIALEDNIGFARGNNLAAREARGDYVLLLNPDTVVLDRAIDRLMTFASVRPDAGIWGGRTVFADGRLNPSSAWGRMTPWRLLCRATGLTGLVPRSSLFNGEALGGWDRSTEREVDIVSGCFLLIKRRLWTALGGFDPTFFMYGEEADLCLRARLFGARPIVTPTAAIVHYGGASETTREGKMVKLLAAKATLIERHFPRGLIGLGLALQALWPLSRAVVLTVAATVLRRPGLEASAAAWRSICRRHRDWWTGYAPPPEINPLPQSVMSSTSG